MTHRSICALALVMGALTVPVAAQAQGVLGGIDQGAREGAHDAGPVGAVVGGAMGGVVGGINGVLGVDQRPRFHSYVAERHIPSYTYSQDVRVGAVLPNAGVTYYEMPPEYGVREYRYTVVNGHTVLVDLTTHRIVEVVD